jgi:hypothetical protein
MKDLINVSSSLYYISAFLEVQDGNNILRLRIFPFSNLYKFIRNNTGNYFLLIFGYKKGFSLMLYVLYNTI